MKARIPQFQEGLDKFYANEGWRDIYDAAPEGAKESLEFMFQNSLCANEGKALSPKELLSISRNRKTKLKKADWEYLLMFAKDPRQIAFYRKCIAKATE